jgi:peptidoglycan/LPS O-acetylase OafA/YrhL
MLVPSPVCGCSEVFALTPQLFGGRPFPVGSNPAPLQREGYRPDIDGLRAVAILFVVAFHAAPSLVPGGFAGVDVFFVISGFLISGIIFRAVERQTFTFRDFYGRRVRRLFPALATMMVAVTLLAWPLFLRDEYEVLGKHIASAAGFVLNLALYKDFTGYFYTSNSTSLIHLWSLGVEEQFYILWPLLIVTAWKLGKRIRIALTAVAAISFAANILLIDSDPLASFYLPTGRLWELTVGGLLAYVSHAPDGAPSSSRALGSLLHPNLISIVGSAVLIASFGILREDFAFPGWWALLPCCGTLLLISAGPDSWINRNVLGCRPIVYVGLISYPLYLWHWPLLAIGRLYFNGSLGAFRTAGVVTTALILAAVTYEYIERPVRFSRNPRRVTALLCATLATCGVLGYLISIDAIPSRPASPIVERIVRASREDWLPNSKSSWTADTGNFITLGSGVDRVLYFGDSNMQQYYPRLAELADDPASSGRSLVFAMKGGCSPVIDLIPPGPARDRCQDFVSNAIAYANDPHVRTVVISAYWYQYLVTLKPGCCKRPLQPELEFALSKLKELIARSVSQGKRVYVILNIPVNVNLNPRRMIRRNFGRAGLQVKIPSVERAEVEKALRGSMSILRQLSKDAGANVIDPMDWLCDATHCPVITAGGQPMYRNERHLNATYVRESVRFLDGTVLGATSESTLQMMAPASSFFSSTPQSPSNARSCGPQVSSTVADPSALKRIRERYGMIGRC